MQRPESDDLVKLSDDYRTIMHCPDQVQTGQPGDVGPFQFQLFLRASGSFSRSGRRYSWFFHSGQ